MVMLTVTMAGSSDRYTNSLPHLAPWGQNPSQEKRLFERVPQYPPQAKVIRLKFYCGYSSKNKGHCDIDNSSVKLSSQVILVVAI